MVGHGINRTTQSMGVIFYQMAEASGKERHRAQSMLNEKYTSLAKVRGGLPHTEYRFLPKELEMPTATEIYGNKIAIFIMTPENPMVVQIENEAVANSFRKYFYILWKSAKKS